MKKKEYLKSLIREQINHLPKGEYAPRKRYENIKADMSLNINPLGVSKKVTQKIKKLDEDKLSLYYPENKELIELIAKYVNIRPENVLLGDGCDSCLKLITETFVSEGDHVIIPTPTFHRYEFHTKLMAGKINFVKMKGFEFDTKPIIQLQNFYNSKLVFLCNPNNPTGMQIKKKKIIDLLENCNGIVVIDEALVDYTEINMVDLIQKYSNLILTRSFSKAFGLASLRIGYLLSSKPIINQIKKIKSPFQVNGVAQELAIETLKDKEFIKKSVKFLNQERQYLINEIKKMDIYCTSSITSNLLVDVEKINPDSQKVVDMFKKEKVLVTNASVFRVPKESYIRISVSNKKENRYFIIILKKLV